MQDCGLLGRRVGARIAALQLLQRQHIDALGRWAIGLGVSQSEH